MTPEQQRAVAIANARARAAEAELSAGTKPPEVPAEPESGETMRAALGRSFDQTLDTLTQGYLKLRGEESASKGLEENIKEKRRLDKPLMDTVSGKIGQGVGDAVQSYALGRGAAGFFPKTLPAGIARYAEAALGSGGVEALKPTVDDESRLANAGAGAAWGLAGQGVGDVVGRAVSGVVKKGKDVLKLGPEAQDAATLGQVADRKTLMGNAVSRLEEASQSVPILGSVTRGARRRGVDAARAEVISKTAPEGFTPSGENTREVIDSIADEYSKRYKGLMQGHKVTGDPGFESRISRILRDPENGLLPAQQKELTDLVSGYYEHMFQINQKNPFGLAANAEKAKDFEGFLTKLGKSYRIAASTGQNARAGGMADALDSIEDAWSSAYKAQLPDPVRAGMKKLDQSYAPFKTVERAASYVGNDAGDFTAPQLLNAVKSRTPRTQFSRGKGLLQEDAQAMKSVFGDKLPDSGTTERQLSTTGGLGLTAILDPTAAAVLGGVPLAGSTRLGRDVMVGDTAFQKLLQKLRTPGMGGPTGQMLQESSGEY